MQGPFVLRFSEGGAWPGASMSLSGHARPNASPLRAEAQNVELVGQLGGACDAVAVQGNTAYVGVGPRLVVLDVSNPASPVVLGQSAVLPGTVMYVAVAGTLAYVVAGGAGLRVVDVSNPAAPRQVGYYPGRAEGVAVSGTLAYVAAGDLLVVDVSNPAAPRELGFYDTPGYAYGVAVSGTLAYVADEEGGLRVVDVSNPASPRELGFYDTPSDAYGVAVSGTLAYVADWEAGLVILRYTGEPVRTPRIWLPVMLRR